MNNAVELVTCRTIWNQAPHCAFTDLIRHRRRWFCAFREGVAHAGTDVGRVRVISSLDGEAWQSAALLSADGDVRDPKLSLAPDGRLALLSGVALYQREPGVTYEGRDPHQTLLWYSADGSDWGAPLAIGERNWWIWRLNWHQGVAYGIGRRPLERLPKLYRSTDGQHFEVWNAALLAAHPEWRGSEASILFQPNGEALCLLRGKEGSSALLGRAQAPYREWDWRELGTRVGGPHLIQLADGRIVVAGRHYEPTPETWLWWLDPAAALLTKIIALPSQGDTSYAGLVEHEGELWVSYYTGTKQATEIRLARVRLPPAKGS